MCKQLELTTAVSVVSGIGVHVGLTGPQANHREFFLMLLATQGLGQAVEQWC